MALPRVSGVNDPSSPVSVNAWNAVIDKANLHIDEPVTITLGTPHEGVTYNNLIDLFAYLKNKRITAQLTISVPAGNWDHGDVVTWDHQDSINIKMNGVAEGVNIVSVGAITSVGAYNHSVVLNLTSLAGAVVGNYLNIAATGIIADPGSTWLAGTWRITAIAGNAVTIRVTDRRATLPATVGITNKAATILKSVLRWNSTVTGGIVFSGVTTGLITYIVFDGQYDNSLGLVDSNTDGLVIATSALPTAGGGADHQTGFSSVSMQRCAAVRWQSNGVYVTQGGVFEASYSAFCSNGYRGIQAVGGGSAVFAKFSVGSGNRGTGAQFELGGALNLANSILAGNGAGGGAGSVGGQMAIQGDSFVTGNGTQGLLVQDGGLIFAELCKFRDNENNHAHVFGQGSQICVENCDTAGATVAAFRERNGGVIYHRGTPPTVAEALRWQIEQVTQQTSKSTAVTLNQKSGLITTHNQTFNIGDALTFTFTNSFIKTYSTVNISMASASAGVQVFVDAVTQGSCRIILWNRNAGTEGVAYKLNYTVT